MKDKGSWGEEEDKCKWADGRWQGLGDGATNYSRQFQTDQCTGHTVKVINWPRGQAGPGRSLFRFSHCPMPSHDQWTRTEPSI